MGWKDAPVVGGNSEWEKAPLVEESAYDKIKKWSPVLLSAIPGGAALKAGNLLEHAAYNAGGRVTDALSGIAPPEVAAGVGAAANVGVQALPSVIGGKAMRMAAPALERGAKQLMQSALKPAKKALETGKAARAIDTMLKEGINVTPEGVAQLRTQISGLNDEIAQAINNSTAKVDKGAVTRYLQEALGKFEKQVTPQADIKVIEKAWNQFLSHPLLAGKSEIAVQLAQQLKQGTYRALGSKSYGELKGAEIEAQKALARGLKDEIARVVPGIERLNKAESELLNAEALASARVLMDSNKNPLGLGWLAKHPASWLGFAVDRSPFLKSLLARGLYAGKEQIPVTAGRVAGAAYGAGALGQPE